MPAKRLSMRKIKEVLRLKWTQGLSNRQIAKACGIALLCMANCHSSGYGCLLQPTAMRFPLVLVEVGTAADGFASGF